MIDDNKQNKNGKEEQDDVGEEDKVYEEEYQVEKIVDHRDTDKGRLYEIKWKGWSSETNTWYVLLNYLHCILLLFFYFLLSKGANA